MDFTVNGVDVVVTSAKEHNVIVIVRLFVCQQLCAKSSERICI